MIFAAPTSGPKLSGLPKTGQVSARASAQPRPAAAPPKQVAITLDDGPNPKFTPIALKVAQDENVPLTFFLIGQEAVRYPDLVRAEAAAGHAIGNHSWHHPLYTVGDTRGLWEVQQTNNLIKSVTGTLPTLFRPPGGLLHTGTAAAAKSLGMSLIFWDATGNDHSPSARSIQRDILRQVHPGSIILLHDGGGRNRYQDMKALPVIIRTLKARGYSFVTVPELLGQPAPMPVPEQALTAATGTLVTSVTLQPIRTLLPGTQPISDEGENRVPAGANQPQATQTQVTALQTQPVQTQPVQSLAVSAVSAPTAAQATPLLHHVFGNGNEFGSVLAHEVFMSPWLLPVLGALSVLLMVLTLWAAPRSDRDPNSNSKRR